MSEDYDKGRPKEIFRYSFNDGKLSFDYKQLPTYTLTENLKPGPLKNGKKRPILGLKGGFVNYNPKIFTVKESKIRMLLLTLLAYESVNKVNNPVEETIDKKEIEILAHNDIFTNITLKSNQVFNIILYKGKMIFAKAGAKDMPKRIYSYIGHKFETIVCKTDDPKDSSGFKLLLDGEFGEWKFKTVARINGFKKYSRERKKTIDDFSLEERLNRYTEIRLCYIPDDSKLNELDLIKSKKEFLEFVDANAKSFESKLSKWLFRSYFGRQDILIIGLRNENMKLVCYEEISIEYELLPFIKEHYHDLYNLFINRESTLNDAFNKIYDSMIALREHEKDVFVVNTKTLEVKKVEEGNGEGGNELFNDILIEEYRSKIEKNEDILDQCSIIDHEQLEELRMKTITDKMDRLAVSNDDDN